MLTIEYYKIIQDDVKVGYIDDDYNVYIDEPIKLNESELLTIAHKLGELKSDHYWNS